MATIYRTSAARDFDAAILKRKSESIRSQRGRPIADSVSAKCRRWDALVGCEWIRFFMWQRFTAPARNSILRAQILAVEHRSGLVSSAHLFLGVLEIEDDEKGEVSTLLELAGVSRAEAILYAQSALESDDSGESEPKLTRGAKRILEWAADEARRQNHAHIENVHLFIACLRFQKQAHVGEVLRPLGLDAALAREHLRGMRNPQGNRAKNPLHYLTAGGEKAIEAAHGAMRASFCGRIGAAHLLIGILDDENSLAVETLRAAGVEIEDLRVKARALSAPDGEIARPQKRFSAGAKLALERAHAKAKAGGFRFIGPEHLLLGLLESGENWREKWKFRGEKLDSVGGLWTSEEVEAIRAALEIGKVPKKSLQREKSVSPVFELTPRLLGILSFGASLIWAVFLFSSRSFRRSDAEFAFAVVGIAVVVVSGIGTCVAIISDRSQRNKELWRSVFAGWIFGIVVWMLLWTHS